MSYWDDDAWAAADAAADEADRLADEEHELAIAQHFADLEADDDRRRREARP